MHSKVLYLPSSVLQGAISSLFTGSHARPDGQLSKTPLPPAQIAYCPNVWFPSQFLERLRLGHTTSHTSQCLHHSLHTWQLSPRLLGRASAEWSGRACAGRRRTRRCSPTSGTTATTGNLQGPGTALTPRPNLRSSKIIGNAEIDGA